MKRLLLLLFAIIPLLVMAQNEFEVDGIYYKRNTNFNLDVVSGPEKYSGDIVIPEVVMYNNSQYSVKVISGGAFTDCTNITSVSIPNTITSIGKGAFKGCSGKLYVNCELYGIDSGRVVFGVFSDSDFNEVEIGDQVTYIGYYTFQNCKKLTSVSIPNSVTSIRDKAFAGCTNLSSIVIPESMTYIGESAFSDCTNMQSINIPEGVTSIQDFTFSGCSSLSTVIMPDSIESIGKKAFFDCASLTSVTIPKKVTTIEESAFSGCISLTNVTIPEGVTNIGKEAFYHCSALSSLTIPNGVTNIGSYAFSGCSDLTTISIPNSIEYFGNWAFYGCKGKLFIDCDISSGSSDAVFYGSDFSEIEIGSNATKIEYHAFYGFENLSKLTIHDGVTTIGEKAFYNCKNLIKTTIGSKVTSIGRDAFYGCKGKLIVNCDIHDGLTDTWGNYMATFNNSEFEEIEIGSSVTSIGSYAFKSLKSIKSVKILPGVVSIGEAAFSGCTGITTFDIPNSTTEIGSNAFSYCTSLSSIEIPNSVTAIGSNLFRGCPGLTSINIPNSVTTIGSSAFEGCTGLTSIEIPNSVTTIGSSAFKDCTGLISIEIPSSITRIESGVFSYCKALTSIIIPESVTYIGSGAFAYCTGLSCLTIPKSITEFEGTPFAGCKGKLIVNCDIPNGYSRNNYETNYKWQYYGLFGGSNFSDVVISNSVSTIGNYAFYGSSINCLIVGAGVTSIGEKVFDYNSKLIKTIWMPNTPPSGYGGAIGTINYVPNKNYSSTYNVYLYPYISSMFEVDGVKYIPISPSERTCDAIDCSYDSNDSIINIGKTVSYKNIEMSVKNINSYTAYNNKFINTVTINADCPIGDYAFQGCTNIETVILNSNGTIGQSAFSGCSAMESIQLGDSIKSIGSSAFYGCKKLEEISIPDATTTIGQSCFSGCSFLVKVNLGSGLTDIPYETFYYCSSLTEVKIPSNVTTIGNYVFSGCKSLSDVIIEDRKTELSLGSGYYSSDPLFKDCPLDSVYIGGNITYNTSKDYGYSPFYRNTSLRTVVITDKEDEIYENEFYGCTNLQNVTIGDGVKKIGDYAFSGCSSLKGFAFGTGLQSIGKEAFSDCTAMSQISSEAKVPPTCGTQALDDLNKWECSLYVPKASIDAYKAADQWKDFLFIDVNVNAKASYKLIYMVDGEIYNESEVDEGATITPLETPVKEGYTFSGWSEIPETMPAHDVTITGAFTVNKYKLTYMVDDKVYNESEVAYGDSITMLEAPVKEGYTFSGWSEIPETMPAHDVTITGAFTVNKYKLTYMVDGQVFNESEVAYGDSITVLETPVKEGYTFSGWSEIPETMPSQDVTITGTFTVNKYKLTYMVDGVMHRESEVEYGSAITPLEDPTKEGYIFSGWSEIPETMPSHDVTITGSFTVNKYKLTYMVDGVMYRESEVEYGSAITPLDAPVKEGYTFSGWSEIPETMPAHDVTITGTFTFNPVAAINPVVAEGSEITEQNVGDITEFKINLMNGVTFAVNDVANVELWIGGVLKATAEKKDISKKDGVVTIKFTAESKNAGTRSMPDEFWKAVAATANDNVEIQVKIAANSFKVNGENIADELCYTYNTKSAVAEKLENEVTALDKLEAEDTNKIPVYNIYGIRIKDNTQKGIIIKNGHAVLVK